MKQGLAAISLMALLSVSLTACVTERTYSGTDTPVTERQFDKLAAARERMQLGLTYLKRGNTEQAKFNLDKAMDYAPELEEVHIAMAYYYQTVGDLIRTAEAYRRAINTRDASGDSMNNFGVFLCQQKEFDESEKMFLKAIEQPKYTRTAASYENLGICSRDAGHIEKARHYFDMALKYDPRRATSLLELAEMEAEGKDFAAAKTQLARYHNVAAESPQSLALGIKIERGLNDSEAAKHFVILLLAKFPASPEAKQYRASLH
ncbi:type IV pilus biogenesis/stability protein PilW [Shewanella cyperi]|uniref:Type IV pilus biogenesis/stability protein PilW n=1 Tax=Shewanella cyperi TaxID=2814292 RepID=A0A974XIG6_9GAMM|nr:type IV pilus biogenesis/stability protein PilW [Shewanella cyperi]QSX29017.1 type IV pilus biogenesis/stability protein PilW [Shewanella cyperi]QSX39751.1 type IV pilus biogenesis/stability protein PilW [Shewanella cyperi]